jgi:7-cyano-7-deazaguanine synthase
MVNHWMNKSSMNSVLILLSGGIDSTALVDYHLKAGDRVEALFINYDQPSYKQEIKSAINICEHYDIELNELKLGFKIKENDGEFFCRNVLMILVGFSSIGISSTFISIGTHNGTPFYDSTITFVKDLQTLLDGYFLGTKRLLAPFINYSKTQVYEYVIKNKVPFELTYSCETGDEIPCGKCLSCIDRRKLDEILSSEY